MLLFSCADIANLTIILNPYFTTGCEFMGIIMVLSNIHAITFSHPTLCFPLPQIKVNSLGSTQRKKRQIVFNDFSVSGKWL